MIRCLTFNARNLVEDLIGLARRTSKIASARVTRMTAVQRKNLCEQTQTRESIPPIVSDGGSRRYPIHAECICETAKLSDIRSVESSSSDPSDIIGRVYLRRCVLSHLSRTSVFGKRYCKNAASARFHFAVGRARVGRVSRSRQRFIWLQDET